MDGTVCGIQRPEDKKKQKKYYSGKHHIFCQKWEVGVRLRDGLICWLTPAFPGKVHDFRVNKEGGLWKLLPDKERVLGDKAYVGNPRFITPRKRSRGKSLTSQQKHDSAVIGTWRMIVEHTFSRLKHFRCLHLTWRHSLSKQLKVFWVCCQLTNMNTKEGSSYFQDILSYRDEDTQSETSTDSDSDIYCTESDDDDD